ncbi:MAG: FtsQ-type POTRA domain-containing protein [Verrucomicrobiaceae bacterium]|nr:FtsQ-type POTRA domain-containing protein [Verrucomicrobiaceae bacterium]
MTPARTPSRSKARRRGFLIRSLAILCLCASLPVLGKWGYDTIFYQNEEFVLRRLNIQTDGVLSEARLAEIANVAAGMNLMELDLEAIRSQVETLPQVEKATVTRELPDRINLIVRERMPVAWLSSPPLGIRPWDMERGYLLDSEGILFRCLDLNDGMKSLPVIESFQVIEPVEGGRIESEGVRSGLKLILESDRRFLEQGMAIAEVRVRDEWAVEAIYQNRLEVTFGVFDYSRGLDDLALILGNAEDSGQRLATVNVAAMKNIPVTFSVSDETNTGGAASSGAESAPVEAVEPTLPENEQEKHLRSILKGG